MKRAGLLGAAAAAATVSTATAEWFRGGSSNGQKWAPARATATSTEAVNSLGWTPKPTPGPAEAILRHELLRRGGTSTCGYFVGTTSPSAAIVCSGSSQCIVNDSNKAMGCCASSNIQACNIATTCIESSEAATISPSAATYTLLCQASNAPSCVTYTYATDSPYSGFRAFACGSKRDVLTVAYTAPNTPSTDITSAAGATTTSTTTASQNSLPSEGGGNAPPITITSSTISQPSSANPTSAGSPTTTSKAGTGGSTSSPAPAPTNDNSNNNTPTILAGVIGGVGGLVIILAGLLSSIFYARKKKKENDPKNRPPIEKVKRPYMPPAFPNSFDYIAAYREARASRRQSGRPRSGFSFRRQSLAFRRRSSMLPFWRQSQYPQQQQQQQQHHGQNQNQTPQRQPSQRLAALPRRSEEQHRIINSSRFPMPPVPKPPRTVRDIRKEEFDFGTRQSPTFSVPVNRNNRGLGPVPASAKTGPGSSLKRHPLTHLESESNSTLPRPSSMSVETSPRRRDGAGREGLAINVRGNDESHGGNGGVLDDEPPSAHTDFDSRFTPPFISPPAGLRSPTNNIGIATVLAPAPAHSGGGGDRVVSTTGATAGSMSKHNSRALPSPRSPRTQQYMLYNPKYGRSKEVPAKRAVGHLNKMQ